MKIALVCDDLVQHGGHEKIILDFCKIFPDAPLFTTYATEKWLDICKENKINLKTTGMQNLPAKEKINRFLAPFMFHVLALENFNFDAFDIVISLSSRFAHGIVTKPKTFHICYMSTVGRMYWEPNSYFERDTFSNNQVLNRLKTTFLQIPLSYTRIWDRVASNRVDLFLCNSKTTQSRIKKYYGRESQIINPSIDLTSIPTNLQTNSAKPYFLVLTRLNAWKKVDLAINACGELNLPLKIIGVGPDSERLKSVAKNYQNIEFLGFCSDEEKFSYLSNAEALINTQLEDFGIVPLESMAVGTPVIAFGEGGALETVIDGKTGLYFREQTTSSLKETLSSYKKDSFKRQDCIDRAKDFQFDSFKEKVENILNSVYLDR